MAGLDSGMRSARESVGGQGVSHQQSGGSSGSGNFSAGRQSCAPKQTELEKLKHELMDVPSQNLINLFESTRRITSEIVPKDTIDIIIRETTTLLNCDRVSLFVIYRALRVGRFNFWVG
jgi:hypothetical protein